MGDRTDVHGGKDPRYSDKSPHSVDEQLHPEPERAVPAPDRCEDGGLLDKPSQAEGER